MLSVSLRIFGLFCILLLLVFGLVGISPAQAQRILEDLKKPMPEIEALSVDAFEVQTVLHEETPSDEKILGHSVRLPNDWTKFDGVSVGASALEGYVLSEVLRYYSPSNFGVRSYFSLQAAALEYQLSAEQWLALYLVENGYTIEGFQTHGEKSAEAVYVVLEGDRSFIVRSLVNINGGHVIVVQYVIPIEEWAEKKALQKGAIDSFSLTYEGDGFAEKMNPYRFLDVAELQYPDSWELRAKPMRSIDRMYVQFFNFTQQSQYSRARVLKGQIDVHLISDFVVGNLEEEIESFKDAFQEGSLVFETLLDEREDFVSNPKLEFSKTYIYDAVDKETGRLKYEVWINIASAQGYYYFTTLTTPSRDKDFGTWVRNTQSFKLLNELMYPLDDSMLGD